MATEKAAQAEKHNRVTIFSNGIADFRRVVEVGKGEKKTLSIPVNKDHIGDILASLNVYGPVSLVRPPAFTPSNQTSGKLTLDANDTFKEIGTKLRGANVKCHKHGGSTAIEGKLLGIENEEVATGGEAVKRYYYSVLTAFGVERVPQSDLVRLDFLDEVVKSEVDKALRRAFEGIKPQSTNVELELNSDGGGTATIHYTVPAAAWKQTYRLRDTGAGLLLDGVCVVDNNTEEDWVDTLLAVVTGEPVTFGTDLAQSKIPHRQTVNVVADRAAGGVEVEQSYGASRGARSLAKGGVARNAVMAACAMPSGAGLESAQMDFYDAEMAGGAPPQDVSAMTADASAKEVGDFSVFEYKTPITVRAGTSATIPVFNHTLGEESKLVLYYKQAQHAERAYRAICFRNDTEFTLGRGVCTIYDKGTYAGSAILSACKKGEEALLCHAIETGVKVRHEAHAPGSNEVTSVKISDGIGVFTRRQSAETTYAIKNNKNEKFTFWLDHIKLVHQGNSVVFIDRQGQESKLETENIKDGVRVRFELQPNEEVTVTVSEEKLVDQRVQIGWNHFQPNGFIATQAKELLEDASIRKCLELQESIDSVNEQIATLEEEFETVEQEQSRAKDLLKSDANNSTWKADLTKTEERLRKISKEEKPALQKQAKNLQKDLNAAIASLTLKWTAPDEPKTKKAEKKAKK